MMAFSQISSGSCSLRYLHFLSSGNRTLPFEFFYLKGFFQTARGSCNLRFLHFLSVLGVPCYQQKSNLISALGKRTCSSRLRGRPLITWGGAWSKSKKKIVRSISEKCDACEHTIYFFFLRRVRRNFFLHFSPCPPQMINGRPLIP